MSADRYEDRRAEGRGLDGERWRERSLKAHKEEFANFKSHDLCIYHRFCFVFLSRNVRDDCLQLCHPQDCSSAPPGDHRT